MGKGRLEAFSDGVLAIIITIMVLELKAPHSPDIALLKPMIPEFVSYVLSFIYVGIYWNNHHHLLHAAREVDGRVLWANLHLLFWLSLIPFATAWMGGSHFGRVPTACYGGVLLCAGFAYTVLTQLLIRRHGKESVLARAIGRDRKGHLSLLMYAIAIPCALLSPWISCAIYALVAAMWLVPDKRIEHILQDQDVG